MNKIGRIKEFTRPYKNFYHIGMPIRTKCLYKFMSLSSLQKSLEDNTLLFRQPDEWHDPFESRFYRANYQNHHINFNTHVYACCVTKRENNEAAWRMYSEDYINNPCVELCLSIGQVRKYIEDFVKEHNASVYEGKVNYELKDNEICSLHHMDNLHYNTYFAPINKEKYLNLLLLKRKAFEYEDEIRYLINDGDFDYNIKDICIPLPWSLCVNNVKLSPFCLEDTAKRVKSMFEANLQLCKSQYPNTYPRVPFISLSALYRSQGPITID